MGMTAAYLVSEIFSRPQKAGFSDTRVITERQLSTLRELILKEAPQGSVRAGDAGSLVWTPPGRVKYVLTEDRLGVKHVLARMTAIAPAESGRLF